VASISLDSSPHVHTAFFAFDDELRLFLLSDPATIHGGNISRDPRVAVAVYRTDQSWQNDKQGLQLFGTCAFASGRVKLAAQYHYAARFVSYQDWFRLLSLTERRAFKSKFYVIEIDRGKIFDEPTFGEETFVSMTVQRTLG